MRVPDLDSEGGVGPPGALVRSPLQELHRVEAGRGFAGRAKGTRDARVVSETPRSFSQRAGSFGGRGAVVGQKVHASLPHYREPLGCRVQRNPVAAVRHACPIHVPSIPGLLPLMRTFQAGSAGRRRSTVSATPGPGTMSGVQLASVTAISDMVAPVVLITTGVLLANGLLSTYTLIIERIRTLKRERLDSPSQDRLPEIDEQLTTMIRRVHVLRGAVLIIFGAITSLVLSVVCIALASVQKSETVGAIALGFVIAGTVIMLCALVAVAIGYAARHGL